VIQSKIHSLSLLWRLSVTAADDEETSRAGRARAVALFRYSADPEGSRSRAE